ncbi:PREDICTED: uncharacterized protein LOC108563712 isoform X2 [Nicrophorus vespilloides]|uniref:Zinc finger CCHC domain-containing protein 7 n=1 Tax=Nicrophorus vespilloides TaxID=110193 RepID=A0ABM1MTQ6_NICVS|nr:PREDICTED: uncharacterized protein LOC108563712 isoform X2 [Nicrophorus vespilloides]
MCDEPDAETLQELESRLYSQIYHSTAKEEPLCPVPITGLSKPASRPRYYDPNKKSVYSPYSFTRNDNNEGEQAIFEGETPLNNIMPCNAYPIMLPPSIQKNAVNKKNAAKKVRQAEKAFIRAASKNAEIFRTMTQEQRKKVLKYQKKQKYLQKRKQKKKQLAQQKLIDKYNGSISKESVICIFTSSDEGGCEIVEQKIDTIDLVSDNKNIVKIEKDVDLKSNLQVALQNEHIEGDSDDDDVIFVEDKKPETVVIDLEPSDTDMMKPPQPNLSLIGTPESTMDFLDNLSETNQGKFNQSIVDGIDLNTPTKGPIGTVSSVVDNCGSESSCSAIDITASLQKNSFKDITMESNLFSEHNLESFANFITPKRNSTVKAKKSSVTKLDFNETLSQSPCKTASDTSSESEYNDSKVAILESNKRKLPDLSYFEDSNDDVVLVNSKDGKEEPSTVNSNNNNNVRESPGRIKKRKKSESSDIILKNNSVKERKSCELHARHKGNILENLNNVWTNNFNMDHELNVMSDNSTNWRIIHADRLRIKRKRSFGPRCDRCGDNGHDKFRCPNRLGKARCSLCASCNHFEPRCPYKLCSGCGNSSHFETNFCSKCANYKHHICRICQMKGHKEQMCPDTWRRYHLTTEDGPPVKCKNILTREPKDRWCSGCGNSGHYEFDCGWNRSMSKNVPFIMNYKDIYRSTKSTKKSPISKERQEKEQPHITSTPVTITSTSDATNTQEYDTPLNKMKTDGNSSLTLVLNPFSAVQQNCTKFIKLLHSTSMHFASNDGKAYIKSLERDLEVSISLVTQGICSIQIAGERPKVNDAAIRINDYIVNPIGEKNQEDIVLANKLLTYMQWTRRIEDLKQLLNKVFSQESTADDVILLNAILFGTLFPNENIRTQQLRTLKQYEDRFQKSYIMNHDERVQLTITMVNFFYKKLTYDEYSQILMNSFETVSECLYLSLRVGTYLNSPECTFFKKYPLVNAKIHFSNVGPEKCAFAIIIGPLSAVTELKNSMEEFLNIATVFPGTDQKIKNKLTEFFSDVVTDCLKIDCGQLYQEIQKLEQRKTGKRGKHKLSLIFRKFHCVLFMLYKCKEGEEYVKILTDRNGDLNNRDGRTPQNILYKVCEAYHFVNGTSRKDINYSAILNSIREDEQKVKPLEYMLIRDRMAELLKICNEKKFEFESRLLSALMSFLQSVPYASPPPHRVALVLKQIENYVNAST